MKKCIIIFTAVCCIAVQDLFAQRYLPGQRGLQLTAGAVNGLNPREGFHAGMAVSTYTGHADRWVFGFEYLEKRHLYKNMHIPQSQFTADAGYYLKFLSDVRKMFFLSVGASAMAGYEITNWNDRLLPDGATVNHGDAFLYGGALTLEPEVYLTDKIVLLVSIRERFLAGTTVGKLNTQFGMGIKYIIY